MFVSAFLLDERQIVLDAPQGEIPEEQAGSPDPQEEQQ